MATSIEGRIFDVLAARLAAFASVPPIAWPDKEFTPPSNRKWLRVTQFRAGTEPVAIAGTTDSHVGFMQVDVFWPLNRGETEALDVAAAIRSHFRSSRKYYGTGVVVEITSARAGSTIRDADQTQIPITINWRAIAST